MWVGVFHQYSVRVLVNVHSHGTLTLLVDWFRSSSTGWRDCNGVWDFGRIVDDSVRLTCQPISQQCFSLTTNQHHPPARQQYFFFTTN